MTHGELKSGILEYLRHRPGRYFSISVTRAKVAGRFFQTAPRGIPDIIGYTGGGVFVGIEVKVGEDRLSVEQRDFKESLQLTTSGVWIEARTIDDVVGVL